jgi:hypothetical protein
MIKLNALGKLAVAIVVILLLLFGFQCWRNSKSDKKADKDVARSQVVEQQHDQQTAASARVDTLIDTVYIREKALTGSADRLRRAADTARPAGLRVVATIADSSAMWKLRWSLLGLAYDTLSEAKRLADLRADSLAVDRSRWHAVADSAVAVMVDLRADLAQARSGCKIIPFVDCPSRKAMLVTGLVVGAGAAIYVEERRRKQDQKTPATISVSVLSHHF